MKIMLSTKWLTVATVAVVLVIFILNLVGGKGWVMYKLVYSWWMKPLLLVVIWIMPLVFISVGDQYILFCAEDSPKLIKSFVWWLENGEIKTGYVYLSEKEYNEIPVVTETGFLKIGNFSEFMEKCGFDKDKKILMSCPKIRAIDPDDIESDLDTLLRKIKVHLMVKKHEEIAVYIVEKTYIPIGCMVLIYCIYVIISSYSK